MKRLPLLLALLICSAIAYAQNLSNWRLTKKHYKGPDWTETITYNYNTNWQLREVKQVQDNKLVQTLTNFTYSSSGKTSGYQEINHNGGNPKTYTFLYDDLGRLSSKQVLHFKDGKENFKTITTFTYNENKVFASKEILTKKGNATVISAYTLDDKGDILMFKGDTNSPNTYTSYKNYDHLKNPLLFTNSLLDKEVLSPNNPKEISFSGASKLDYVIKKNSANLVTAIEEHIDNGAYKIINGSTYTYTAIKK